MLKRIKNKIASLQLRCICIQKSLAYIWHRSYRTIYLQVAHAVIPICQIQSENFTGNVTRDGYTK